MWSKIGTLPLCRNLHSRTFDTGNCRQLGCVGSRRTCQATLKGFLVFDAVKIRKIAFYKLVKKRQL